MAQFNILPLQRVVEEYRDKETSLALVAKIKEDSVSLRIPSEKDGWTLFALKSLVVRVYNSSVFEK